MAFRLVNKRKLLRPGKCVVCESVPQHRVVDTGFNLMRTSVTEVLRGRKYACESCGEKIAKALGFKSPREFQDMDEYIIALEETNTKLQRDIDLQKKIDGLLEELQPLFDAQLEPEVANEAPMEE